MSTINVTNLSGRGGATPNLPDGANVTGVVTATSFDGSLKTTGTPTLGLGVTINASGVAISGVATAGIGSFTTVYGDGSNMTGVGESIAPWYYQPDVNDVDAKSSAGIGITFNKRIVAGSGTATLKIVNAGAAGTTIQSWGISSVTIPDATSFNASLVSNLLINQTYQFDIPNGFLKDSQDTNYVGTAWTFTVQSAENKLFSWGDNENGRLGLNDVVDRSSPTQIPATTWSANSLSQDWFQNSRTAALIKTDGTLWNWGLGGNGGLGQNDVVDRSSPVQIPGTTWATAYNGNEGTSLALKTDGTLWGWGNNEYGELGINDITNYSSPKQIPGTTWATGDYKISGGQFHTHAIKTDGTLWIWGDNSNGILGQNNEVKYSSPVQIPGTTWAKTFGGQTFSFAIKTDGTLWGWGENSDYGMLGQNDRTSRSSPVQIPGTTWASGTAGYNSVMAIKTDGTLWGWGENEYDCLGLNTGNDTHKSSPVQVPGTTWSKVAAGRDHTVAVKTDGTLWGWGENRDGQLGLNSTSGSGISSPTQIGSETVWTAATVATDRVFALLNDQTP